MNHMANADLQAVTDAVLQPSGAAGLYARTGLFEHVVEGLSSFITRQRVPDAEVLRFPPVMSRRDLEKAGYLQSFPHLLGCVCSLHGNEGDIRALVDGRRSAGAGSASPDSSWDAALSTTDLVLTPAACYPLYPLVAARGSVFEASRVFDIASYCFRRESSHEVGRLQAFRMREYVCIGTAEQAVDFRARWISRAEDLAKRLGLRCRIDAASDPFFGRVGKLMAMSQVEQALKFELLVPLRTGEPLTACMSFNYHRDHFGSIWGLRTATGEVAHTACVAFGLDRLALGLFAGHGLDLREWPAGVREVLSI